MPYEHTPVMLEETMSFLAPVAGKNYIDGTLGGAGYSLKLAELAAPGIVLAIDLDSLAIKNAAALIREKNITNIKIVHDNFANLENILEKEFGSERPDFAGLVLDLGLSSAQLADRSRGFSFAADAPLDMSFGGSGGGGPKTTEIVNWWPESDLEMIFREYGEERFARRIAAGIIGARRGRPIATTAELTEIIRAAVPRAYAKKPGIHFATRTFQALRIATNQELDNLESVLPAALRVLARGARIVVISYHSLEDRIVKDFFRQEAKGCVCPPELPVCQCGREPRLKIITKKIITPSQNEIKANPRARSAKLRSAEVI